MSRVGVMICGHGSRDENAVEEFDAVARGLRERLPQYQVESGFLEFATPIIRDGLDKLHAVRHDLVLAVPGMLFAAGHAKNDIPSVLRTYEAQHPDMEIRYARELGIDPKMLKAAGDRIQQALDRAGFPQAAFTVRGMGFRDGAEDVRLFRRACLEGKVAPGRSLLLRAALAEARTVADPAGNEKLAKGVEGRRRRLSWRLRKGLAVAV